MSTSPLAAHTYLPEDERPLGAVHDFMEALDRAGLPRPEKRCFLAGPSSGDRVELPGEVYDVLRQVVDAMRSGLAVTVAPMTQTVSTQQAAEVLGVSRPTVVKLLDEGAMPYEQVRSHRKILLKDVLDHRERRRDAQHAALDAMADDDDEALDTVLSRLRETRRVVAARRQITS